MLKIRRFQALTRAKQSSICNRLAGLWHRRAEEAPCTITVNDALSCNCRKIKVFKTCLFELSQKTSKTFCILTALHNASLLRNESEYNNWTVQQLDSATLFQKLHAACPTAAWKSSEEKLANVAYLRGKELRQAVSSRVVGMSGTSFDCVLPSCYILR